MKAPFTRLGRAALCFTVFLLAPSAGQAALLLPGSVAVPDILTEAPVAVEASVLQGLVSDNFTGSLTAAVVRNAGGTLDFYYQITNDAGSSSNVERNVNSAFATTAPPMVFTTEVFYRTDNAGLGSLFSVGSSAAPLIADRNANARRVGFNFSAIAPGETSPILVIRTNATSFTNGVSLVSDDLILAEDTFDSAGTFQPAAAAIPEPASLVLLSSAFAAAGYMARHRARRRKPGSA
jgi:hypothetical protein